MNPVFGVVSKKSSLYPTSSRFSPVLPSRSFIVFYLTVRCKTHLELIFVKDVRSVSRFIFLNVDVWSGTTCWKGYLYSILFPLLLCQRPVASIYVALLLGSWFCWSVCLFFREYYGILDYCTSTASLEARECQCFCFVLSIVCGLF